MAVPMDAIVDALKADPVIATLAIGGIYDHDLRRSNDTLPTDDFGDVIPYVAVDDAGGGRDPFSPASGSFSDRCFIWVFGPQNRPGRLAVEGLISRALIVLHRWQDPVTGTMVVQGDRLGVQATDAPDQSYMDRLTLKVAGITSGVAW